MGLLVSMWVLFNRVGVSVAFPPFLFITNPISKPDFTDSKVKKDHNELNKARLNGLVVLSLWCWNSLS